IAYHVRNRAPRFIRRACPAPYARCVARAVATNHSDVDLPGLPHMIADGTCEASDSDLLVTSPLVSVLMTTYNHAEYLADAIEGVVNQRCPFSFELIIGEDASTDA